MLWPTVKMRIISSFTVLLVTILTWMLFAQDLPYRSSDKATQWNYDEIAKRGSFRLPDYGRTTMSAGSSYVALNIDYFSPDTFFAFASIHQTGYLGAADTVHTYLVRKLSGSEIIVYAIQGQGVRDYTDSSEVEYFTFLKDR